MALAPSIDGEELLLRAELPDIDPRSDLSVEVENGILKVSGERRRESKTERSGFVRTEKSYGRFERRIGLPDGVDAEHIHATYDRGVLEVVIPLPAKKATKVRVEVTDQLKE